VTDGRTDGRTDGIAVASTALAMRALRRAVKMEVLFLLLQAYSRAETIEDIQVIFTVLGLVKFRQQTKIALNIAPTNDLIGYL